MVRIAKQNKIIQKRRNEKKRKEKQNQGIKSVMWKWMLIKIIGCKKQQHNNVDYGFAILESISQFWDIEIIDGLKAINVWRHSEDKDEKNSTKLKKMEQFPFDSNLFIL